MLQCNGEIGTLVQGEQIGGFLDWSIDLQLLGVERPDGKLYHKAQVKATAQRYWLFSIPEGEITANFYRLIRDRLVLINSHTVQIYSNCPLNKMIDHSLEMIWMS